MANTPESTYIYRMGTAPNTRAAVSQKNKVFSYMVGKDKFQQIGAVSEFGFDESRTIDPVRGVGFGDQVAELVPSVTEPMTLTVNATLLYAMNLFQAMGYKAGVDGIVRSLKHHRWPFDIKQELVFSHIASDDTDTADGLDKSGFKDVTAPAGGFSLGATPKALFTIFEGCWFNSYSASFTADAAIVAQNSSITVTDIVDGYTVYGEYIETGLAPRGGTATPGNGASYRFSGGTQNNAGG